MISCDTFRELSAAALYGELEGERRTAFDAHLASCGTCRAEYDGLRATLALMDRRERAEPTEEEWRAIDRRLEERIASTGHGHTGREKRRPETDFPSRPRIFTLFPAAGPAWGYGIAAVFLLAVGFFVGRTFFTDTGLIGTGGDPETFSVLPGAADSATGTGAGTAARPDESFSANAPGPAGEAATMEALGYLERSRNLLIGLTNLDEGQATSLDMRRQQEVSRELYDTGNTLAVALNKPSQQQLRQLVQQLQIILLQLSNAGLTDGRPAVEIIRRGVDANSLILKINLEAIRAALQESADRPADKGKTSL